MIHILGFEESELHITLPPPPCFHFYQLTWLHKVDRWSTYLYYSRCAPYFLHLDLYTSLNRDLSEATIHMYILQKALRHLTAILISLLSPLQASATIFIWHLLFRFQLHSICSFPQIIPPSKNAGESRCETIHQPNNQHQVSASEAY